MKVQPLTKNLVASEVARLRPSQMADQEVAAAVSFLIEQVRSRGDAAVVEATARFDWKGASASSLLVSSKEIEGALAGADPALLEALETTQANCRFFHQRELSAGWEERGPQGQTIGLRRLPVKRAGLYVPGGLGSYASTVIMNCVPAQVAGVGELVICTPPGADGQVNSSVLAAAALMGVTKVFRVGGAQAIAALAYGTESIPRVDIVCGPGNAYVREAKRQVYGAVGIDSLAGPSEVLIVADDSANPQWVAADLLAQEEHGSGAQGLLVAETGDFCEAVLAAVARLTEGAPGQAIPSQTSGDLMWGFYPAAGEDFLELAEAIVNEYAPEHLELQIREPRVFLPRVRAAGAIFVGGYTPTAFGDYVAGTNHVLPTGGSARFASPLSVDTFLRRSSYVELDLPAAAALTPPLARLADSEGFFYHRLSAELRTAAENQAKSG